MYAGSRENCPCDGHDISPELSWAAPPDRTRSFALIVTDKDSPLGLNFVHWVLYDLPADKRELPQEVAKQEQPPDGSRRTPWQISTLDAGTLSRTGWGKRGPARGAGTSISSSPVWITSPYIGLPRCRLGQKSFLPLTSATGANVNAARRRVKSHTPCAIRDHVAYTISHLDRASHRCCRRIANVLRGRFDPEPGSFYLAKQEAVESEGRLRMI